LPERICLGAFGSAAIESGGVAKADAVFFASIKCHSIFKWHDAVRSVDLA
jgi:hypothetical protein